MTFSLWDYMKPCLPTDHDRQSASIDVLKKRLADDPRIKTVIDLGCGTGTSLDVFRAHDPEIRWIGIDIESSPEVDARTRDDGEFLTYDGINIPVEDSSIDLIYSHQVFEHVRHPEPLLRDIRRVLKPGKTFVGSVSQFEPYHSFSLWNFTIYGFKTIVEDAGLELIELRPGMDAITLIMRSVLGRPQALTRYFKHESILNQLTGETVRKQGRGVQVSNFRKLMYAGQYCFVVRKA